MIKMIIRIAEVKVITINIHNFCYKFAEWGNG